MKREPKHSASGRKTLRLDHFQCQSSVPREEGDGGKRKQTKQKKMSALKSIRRMQVKKTVDSETTARESGPSFETRVATWQGHGDF